MTKTALYLLIFLCGYFTSSLTTTNPVKIETKTEARCLIVTPHANNNLPCKILKSDLAYVRFYY